jgi:hypothetical protein
MQLNEAKRMQQLAGIIKESQPDEPQESSNSEKEITVILRGNKEISYTEEDIKQFIEDVENDPSQISSDSLPGWLYRDLLSQKKISLKNKSKAVIRILQNILDSNRRDIRIGLNPNTPPEAKTNF